MNHRPNARSFERLPAHRLCQTGDLGAARAIVASKFCAHRLEQAGGGFDACHNRAAGHGLSLNYLRYGAEVQIEPGELTSFYLIQIPLAGTAEIHCGRDHASVGPGRGSVLNPTRHARMLWRAGCEKVLVQIDRTRLHAAVETLLGLHLPVPVVFQTAIDLSRPALALWARKLAACLSAAEAGHAFGARRGQNQLLIEEELLGDFILAKPSNVSALIEECAPGLAPRHLRRAQAHIHHNLAEPMTIADLAGIAGVSARTLQLGFLQAFGLSPLQYLRQMRLRLAHLELAEAPAGRGVSDVAYTLGFTHPGRFAIRYKEMFGCSPAQTLGSGRN